jgi:anti-anti-sigma regulatory factor
MTAFSSSISGTKVIEGPDARALIISTVASWHRAWKTMSDHKGELVISLENVTEFDAFGLQLLASFVQSARRSGRVLTIRGASDALREAGEKIGFSPSALGLEPDTRGMDVADLREGSATTVQ